MSRKGVYTVLIVSEGSNTEPSYFESLKKYLNENYEDLYPNGIDFTIFPYSPEKLELIEAEDENDLFVRRRGNRPIIQPAVIINEDIEDQYKSEPLRWVRYAQKEAEGAGYDQVWAVFDYDNRPDKTIEKTLKLSKKRDGDYPNIGIAYSSYSFEYWLVLHYELFIKNLEKSECKDEDKNSILCGTNVNQNDCQGSKCLSGYLSNKDQNLRGIIKSKKSTFPYVEQHIFKACIRAEYILNLPENTGKKLYEKKPVTTVNKLITSLITTFPKITWSYDGKINFGNYEINSSINQNSLLLNLETNGKETILIKKNMIKIYDKELIEFNSNKSRILEAKEASKQILQINLKDMNLLPLYFSIEVNNTLYITKV